MGTKILQIVVNNVVHTNCSNFLILFIGFLSAPFYTYSELNRLTVVSCFSLCLSIYFAEVLHLK